MDLSKYRQLYVSETYENLEAISGRIVDLEADPKRSDHLDSVFRLFHSIKGMSGTMGYEPLMDLAHDLEELMERVRAGKLAVDEQICDILLGGVDRMTQWVSAVEHDRPISPQEGDALRARIGTLVGGGSAPPVEQAPVIGEVKAAAGEFILHARLRAGYREPGLRGVLLVQRLAWLGRVSATSPPIDQMRAGALAGEIEVALETQHEPAQIASFVMLLPEWSDVTCRRAAPLPVTADDLLFTGDILGLTPVPDLAPPAMVPPVSLGGRRTTSRRASRRVSHSQASIVVPPTRVRTIRVRTDWLDTLLDDIADLRIVKQRLQALEAAAPRPDSEAALSELGTLLDTVHDRALSVRMMPLSILTDHLRRAVRDLSRQANKRATLEVEGADQRLDRAIIEGLDAPLTHMVRNAIDHGIERPAAREAAGKPPVGTLRLTCARVREEIVVSLSDDGGGIDRARLVDRAVSSGLLGRERAEALAAEHLDRLIAQPGLSVRESADVMAGRGVGMDAVRQAIIALGGSVEVLSEQGQGTTIRLHLPRTPGIAKILQVEVAGQRIGIPAARVVKIHDPGAGPTADAHDLRPLLRLPSTGPKPRIVVDLRTAGRAVSILVDATRGEHEAILKPSGPLIERVEGILGVTIDGLGVPVIIIDVARIGAPD